MLVKFKQQKRNSEDMYQIQQN